MTPHSPRAEIRIRPDTRRRFTSTKASVGVRVGENVSWDELCLSLGNIVEEWLNVPGNVARYQAWLAAFRQGPTLPEPEP